MSLHTGKCLFYFITSGKFYTMNCLVCIIRGLVVLLIVSVVFCSPLHGQVFVHPGIDQQSKDLAYMKKMVLAGRQPWRDAFTRLKAATDTSFTEKAHAHVLRGPYGKPNIGGDDLSKSANMAYNNALVWYITNDKTYAAKAIEILNTWSAVLWDLDYNDAKLLAAWTGHVLCNAAEILRYTNTGWRREDIAAFSNMLMTVYYPLLRPYYPQANGNWEGAIIHSMIAIAVFTDNRALFNDAINHVKYGTVNGSIFKYIYPNGQCQESPRDQGHVQLGIGEFAGAAQAAFTQGVDLFSMADNRIALGFEYTAGYLLGDKPYCYCNISERAKVLRDDYEYVYRHYTTAGLSMPNVKRAADSIRAKASRSVLVSVRALSDKPVKKAGIPKASTVGYIAGADAAGLPVANIPPTAIIVLPGDPIQKALDSAAATNGQWILLKAGIHTLPHTLRIPSGITIKGENASTILFLDPSSGEREALINADTSLHDITIRDLVIEASNRTDPGTDPNTYRSFKGGYNRGGILFRAGKEGQMQHISFINLTVRNATYSGVSLSGADHVTITNCNFDENGANVPPGPKLLHNLLLAHCADVNITGSRFDTSPTGSGISFDHCSDVTVTNSEIARNGYFGVLIAESKNFIIKNNLIEANDRSGIMAEFLFRGTENITISNNRIQYNNGYGIETYAAKNCISEHNLFEGNHGPQKISTGNTIKMEP